MTKTRIIDKRIILPEGTAPTPEILREVINTHKTSIAPQHARLKAMYIGNHEILRKKQKAKYKPDHRLVANYARYLVDTFTGYFTGIPVKITHEDENVSKWIEEFSAYTGLEDTIAEVSKSCDMYGLSPLLLYMDEESMPCVMVADPSETFVVYDDSILHRPMYGVRYYRNAKGLLEGTLSDAEAVYSFDANCRITGGTSHPFGGVPVLEFCENEERIGLIESVRTLIDEFDHVLSEKANDVDYYADAYLKILGKKLDTETIKTLRDNRIINMAGKDTDKLIIEFLQKPDADATSEHLLDRLDKLIFNLSMVANISDENFGNTSGTALAYKLQPMDNLAKMKERKFTTSLQKMFHMLAFVPTTKLSDVDWLKVKFKFSQNIPRNLLEESQVARNLEGLVSDETLMKVLSIVQDVRAEVEAVQEQRAQEEADDLFVRDD